MPSDSNKAGAWQICDNAHVLFGPYKPVSVGPYEPLKGQWVIFLRLNAIYDIPAAGDVSGNPDGTGGRVPYWKTEIAYLDELNKIAYTNPHNPGAPPDIFSYKSMPFPEEMEEGCEVIVWRPTYRHFCQDPNYDDMNGDFISNRVRRIYTRPHDAISAGKNYFSAYGDKPGYRFWYGTVRTVNTREKWAWVVDFRTPNGVPERFSGAHLPDFERQIRPGVQVAVGPCGLARLLGKSP